MTKEITITIKGKVCKISCSLYRHIPAAKNKTQLCINLSYRGQPYGTPTVQEDLTTPEPDEILIRDYDENKGMPHAFEEAGIAIPVYKTGVGYYGSHAWMMKVIHPEILAIMAALRSEAKEAARLKRKAAKEERIAAANGLAPIS